MAEESAINRKDIVDPSAFTGLGQLNNALKEIQGTIKDVQKVSKSAADAIKKATTVSGVKKQIDDLTASQKKLNDANKLVIASLKEEIVKLKDTDAAAKKAGDSVNRTSDLLKKGGAALVAFFAVDRIMAFVGAVVKITAEFQKFSAVLTNTLGSRAAAGRVLSDIKDFAANTPYGVAEVTASFVKLANSGFKPTIKELTKLGDLAASQGKSFDQLTEAIIDAQTGEFERLKEFGVRAQKEGDKVSFTFKGVKQQVDFTADSIQKYVLGLGDAVGVSGGMAAISKTLGGQISNLGDGWDAFLVTLGEGNNGALSGTVSLLSKALAIATDLVKTEKQSAAEIAARNSGSFIDRYKTSSPIAQVDQEVTAKRELLRVNAQIDQSLAIQSKYANGITVEENDYLKALRLRKESLEQSLELVKAYRKETNDKDNSDADKAALAEAARQLAIDKMAADAHEKTQAMMTKAVAEYLKDEQQLRDEDAKLTQDQIKDEVKARQDAADAIGQIDEDQVKAAYDLIQEEKKAYEDAEKAKVKAVEDAEKQKQQLVQAGFQSAASLSQAYFNSQQDQLDEQKQKLSDQRDYELELAGDNKDAKTAINKKYDAEDRKFKAEQAKRDKQATIASILLNTARAIVAALPNVPLSIIVGATGLAELAIASGVKLPAFAKGTKKAPGGLAMVGEDGTEAIIHNGTTMLTPDEATIMHVPKDAEVLTNSETMKRVAMGTLREPIKRNERNEGNKDIKELTRVIKNKKEVSINVTSEGVALMVQQANNKTFYLDKFCR